MLSALTLDLLQCGHEVHTCLDEIAASIAAASMQLNLSAELVVKLVSQDWKERWTEIALHCDRTIVIAPELDQQLERIISELRSAGAFVVASSDLFLKATSDKLHTASLIQRAKVPHPATQSLLDCKSDSKLAAQGEEPTVVLPQAFPLTLKRRDGAGCSEMMYFDDRCALLQWLRQQTRPNWQDNDWIVQRWQPGMAASVAFIAGEEWQIVGSMEQMISIQCDKKDNTCKLVEYVGGSGPLEFVSEEQLESLLERVRRALPDGASGWIGVDFIVGELQDGDIELVLIEVNPRLTTSYLGYRQWYGHRLADCLLGCLDVAEMRRRCDGPRKRITFSPVELPHSGIRNSGIRK